ncbi:MAG TPA: glycosyltransferase family protein [Syntrophorhabdales bacterium]|nr:glycosyltransferase family protein [Syntrophorhabdales bacterium]
MSREQAKAIVQARMGSTRLFGKILKPLAGKSALWHVVDRLNRAKELKEIIVATTTNQEDDVVVKFCEENGIRWFRGSENDVLDRYYQAAKAFTADPIIRITADCPVVDPVIVDEVIEGFFAGNYDVYRLGGEFPDGLDCECFAFWAIEDAWKVATLPSEREHVGVYPVKHPEKYRVGSYEKFSGLGHLRWTFDEEADLRFLQAIYERLYRPGTIFRTGEILELLQREPELMSINQGITRNEGLLKSLLEDEASFNEKSL